MKDLNKLYIEVLEDVMNAGINPGNITDVLVDRRSKRRGGCCIRYGSGRYTIKIAAFVLEDRVAEQVTKDIIAHEIIHSVKGCMNHGEPWKEQAAVLMAYKPEYKITRTYNAADVGRSVEEEIEKARYVYKCRKCGAIVWRNRESKFTRNPERYSCGNCYGKFITIRRPDDRQLLVAACRFPS